MELTYLAGLVWNGVTLGLLLALPALAVTLVLGIAKFPNIAIGDTMALGAYVAFALTQVPGVNYGLAFVGGLGAAAGVSLLSYLLIFRKLETKAMVASLLASTGLAFLLRSAVTVGAGGQPKTYGLPFYRPLHLLGIDIFPLDLMTSGIGLGVLVLVFLLLYRTSVGRQLRAVADNPALARATAINKARLNILLWSMFGLLAGLGGILVGARAVMVPEFGWDLLIPVFAAVILGGIGNPAGAVAGAVIMGVAQEVTVAFLNQGFGILISFLIMALILLIRPSGLLGIRVTVR